MFSAAIVFSAVATSELQDIEEMELFQVERTGEDISYNRHVEITREGDEISWL